MKIHKLFPILLLAALLLSACTPATTPEAPQAAEPEVVEPAAEAQPEAKPEGSEQKLILATTSSTQDSGLLDVILPVFEQETGIKVDAIAVGTGQALQLGMDGNADVLLVHARAKEDEFMANGHGVRREDVMYNDFVILGPEADPAGIKGMTIVPTRVYLKNGRAKIEIALAKGKKAYDKRATIAKRDEARNAERETRVR